MSRLAGMIPVHVDPGRNTKNAALKNSKMHTGLKDGGFLRTQKHQQSLQRQGLLGLIFRKWLAGSLGEGSEGNIVLGTEPQSFLDLDDCHHSLRHLLGCYV